MEKIRTELKEIFPYKIILVDRAEADDVVAVLTQWFQTNELIQSGLIEVPQEVMIISSDKDYLQLQKYHGVSQWSPKTKTLLTASKNYMKEDHIIHIVKASDDGIPSIVNDDLAIIDTTRRQKPVSKKRIDEFLEKGQDACKDDFERKNWIRNQTLIDFDFIPQSVKDSIIQEYLLQKPERKPSKIMNYFIENRCRNLMKSIENF
jgi:hypothetical protein